MRSLWATVFLIFALAESKADTALLRKYCAECHGQANFKGKFNLGQLGFVPSLENFDRWLDAVELVETMEMPPEDADLPDDEEREKLLSYLKNGLSKFGSEKHMDFRNPPRRLNNREFVQSVADALLIEDVGTHQPTANLVGDSLYHGFDTHGATLGMSKYHLEQYILAVRKIVDATILSDQSSAAETIKVTAPEIISEHTSQNTTRPERKGTETHFDFLDPKQRAYFEPFKTVPTTGRYRFTLQTAGMDRRVYSTDETGVYHGDPIRLVVEMGDRKRSFALPEGKKREINLDEWLAAGTRLRLHYPTDGLTFRGNGNFKFQYAIAGEYLKLNDPREWNAVANNLKSRPGRGPRRPESWHNWTNHWQGPRPRIYGATIKGPLYENWPPSRQQALLGEKPSIQKSEQILSPIAERAWRRPPRQGELDPILALVREESSRIGETEALKEGIVAILISPSFLLLNSADLKPSERFASKLSTFLAATLPDQELRSAVDKGELDDAQGILKELKRRIKKGEANAFLEAFPTSWLELNDVNFMAPDPDQFRFYHRKRLSEDMVEEALIFFRHMIENNLPLTDFLSADYSFINADLAKLYAVEILPLNSSFRKHVFVDGRRGGLLGMGAFLTGTADSLTTSPIHRAVYVMENLLGIIPTPPPPDLEIAEPDVRQAKTIKQILEAHQKDPSCASCHRNIDPFGHAFENFDPTGAWREEYEIEQKGEKSRKIRLPIDPSSSFRNGIGYSDIVEYRKALLTKANQERFVQCFVEKILTYANGVEPGRIHFKEIERILKQSEKNQYRIVDTIAFIINSPLFREIK